MYANVGVRSARGTGTSGYVSTNLAALRRNQTHAQQQERPLPPPQRTRKQSPALRDHDRKRQIELECLQLQEHLLEQNELDDEQIAHRVHSLRTARLEQLKPTARDADAAPARDGAADSAAASEPESDRMKSALRIAPTYQHGQAFDRELKERERQERLAKRAAEEAEKADLLALLEKEERKEDRRQRKQKRRAERAEREQAKRARVKARSLGSRSASRSPSRSQSPSRSRGEDAPREGRPLP